MTGVQTCALPIYTENDTVGFDIRLNQMHNILTGSMLFNPFVLRGAGIAAVQNADCYLIGTEFTTIIKDSTNAGDLLVGGVSGPHVLPIIVIGKVQTEPQREIIPLNLTTQERDVRHRSITADDVSVDFTVKSRRDRDIRFTPT